MKNLNRIYTIKRVIGIISIIAWFVCIILIAFELNNWFKNPSLPLIAHQNIFMFGGIVLVKGFHPTIWTFDFAIITSVIWLIMQLIYSKHK